MSRRPQRISRYKPRHRRILTVEQFEQEREHYHLLAEEVKYTGHPHHKSNPGDFGLEPPRAPRWEKTLCDYVGILKRSTASQLLRKAFQRGLISEAKSKNDARWPQHAWAVTDDGHPLEAEYDGEGYHGYPLPDERTPLFLEIIKRWNNEN